MLDDAPLRDRAVKAADFILKRLRRADGSLVHAFLDGPSVAPGYAEDYSAVVRALLELYEATGEVRWLRSAAELQDKEIEILWDKEDGGFFDGPPQPLLFNRMKSVDESTEFSATSVSTHNLIRLHALLGRGDYLEKAKAVFTTFAGQIMRSPGGFIRLLASYDLILNPPVQVIVCGAPDAPDRADFLGALRRSLPFGRVILYLDGGESQAWLVKENPALAKLATTPGKTTVHFCRDFVPVQSFTKPGEIAPALQKAVTAVVP